MQTSPSSFEARKCSHLRMTAVSFARSCPTSSPANAGTTIECVVASNISLSDGCVTQSFTPIVRASGLSPRDEITHTFFGQAFGTRR